MGALQCINCILNVYFSSISDAGDSNALARAGHWQMRYCRCSRLRPSQIHYVPILNSLQGKLRRATGYRSTSLHALYSREATREGVDAGCGTCAVDLGNT